MPAQDDLETPGLDPAEASGASGADAPERPEAPAEDAAGDPGPVPPADRAGDKVELDLDDALFLQFEEQPAVPAPEAAPAEQAGQAAPGRPRRKLILLLAAGVLLLAGLGTGAFVLLRPAAPPVSKAAPPVAAAQPQPDPAYPCLDSLAPAEAVELVRQAARLLAGRGRDGLAELRDPKSRWACPDAGIVVFDSSRRTQLVNPAAPRLVGLDVSADRSPEGVPYIVTVGELGQRSRGGWMEKVQPRPAAKPAGPPAAPAGPPAGKHGESHGGGGHGGSPAPAAATPAASAGPLPDVPAERARKVFYILGVPGTPYQVGAGLYDEATPLAELEQLIPAE